MMWSWHALAALIILLALASVVGRQVVFHAEEYRGDVERYLSERFHLTVSIGQLTGRWTGLSPSINAESVLILDPKSQRVLLEAGHIQVTLDALASMRALAPRLAIGVDGVKVDLVEAESSRWRISGWPSATHGSAPALAQATATDPDDARKALEPLQLLLEQPVIHVRESRVHLLGKDRLITLYIPSLKLENSGERHVLAGHVRASREDAPLEFSVAARFWGNSFDLKRTRAQVYLKLAPADLTKWLTETQWRGLKLEQMTAGGEIWAAWRQGRFGELISRAAVSGVQLRDAGDTPLPIINELSAEMKWQYDAEKSWNLAIQKLTLDSAGKHISDARLDWKTSWDHGSQSRRMDAQLSGFQLGILVPYLAALDLLNDAQREKLAQTAPDATLKQAQLHWRSGQTQTPEWTLSGYLEDFNSHAFEKLPGVKGVSGFFSLDKNQGLLELSGRHVLLDYPSAFRQPISAAVSGPLRWQRDADGFRLESGVLRAENEHVHGAVQLNLQIPTQGEPELALHASLYNGKGEFTPLYIPAVIMRPSLVDWLDRAIQGGHLLQGDIMYNGPLKVDPMKLDARTLQLRFQVENAKLEYLPEWPAVEQGVADVLITNREVDVTVLDGHVLGARIQSPASVTVPKFDHEAVPHLKVQGQLNGEVESGLAFLQQSPLQKTLGTWIHSAKGKGNIQVKLDIDALLAKKPGSLKLGVDVQVDQSELRLESANLTIQDVNGLARYDSNKGLSAKKITGRLFDDNAVGTISTQKLKNGDIQTIIGVVGMASIAKVAEWNPMAVLKPLQGRASYNAELNFRRGEEDGVSNNRLRIWSPLKGVAVKLPPPLFKAADDASTLYTDISLGGDIRQVQVEYAGKLTAALELDKDQIVRGQVVYGPGRANFGANTGLDIFIRIPEFDLTVWKNALSEFSENKTSGTASGGAKAASSGGVVSQIHQISLQTSSFKGFGQTLQDLNLMAEHKQDSWQLDVQSERLEGSAKFPDALLGAEKLSSVAQPIDIHIDKIKFPEPEKKPVEPEDEREEVVYVPEPKENDPLYRVDPRELPGVNLQIDELWQGTVNQGRWNISAYPTPGGLALSKVDVSIWGMQIEGEGSWKRADDQHTTEFDGTVSTKDVAKVISNLDSTPTLESNDGRIKAALSWEGSPAWFSLQRTSGELNVRIRKGRFVKAPATATAARVMGILNLETLGRRLQLDFSDLYKSGVAFDSISGKFAVHEGVMKTDNLGIRGPSTQFDVKGDVNVRNKRVHLTIAATVPLSRNLILPAAATGGLPLAATAYLIEKTLGSTLDKLATLHYDVSGHWNNPEVQRRNIILPNNLPPASSR